MKPSARASPRPIKLIIAGSRTITHYDVLLRAISEAQNKGLISENFEVVSGGASGVDFLAKKYAETFRLPYYEFLPEYSGPNDRTAPLHRNQKMAIFGDVLLAIWDGQSKGTKHMIDSMKTLEKPVLIIRA